MKAKINSVEYFGKLGTVTIKNGTKGVLSRKCELIEVITVL